MTDIDWMEMARGFIANVRKTAPLMRPPAIQCFVRWRKTTRVGAIQVLFTAHPAIVLLSVTSRHVVPEFIAAIRQLDPDRVDLEADDMLDLIGPQHVLHRHGNRLMIMTPNETRIAAAANISPIQITPTATGVHYEGVVVIQDPIIYPIKDGDDESN